MHGYYGLVDQNEIGLSVLLACGNRKAGSVVFGGVFFCSIMYLRVILPFCSEWAVCYKLLQLCQHYSNAAF